jgi:beta-mannosidase
MYYAALNDNWQIRPLSEFSHGIYPRNDDGWLPAIVPAHWQQLPGLETHSGKVVYRCRFPYSKPADSIPDERYWLRINGVFYYRHTYFNGVDLGAHEGYFEPTEHDITALLRTHNTLIIEIDCPDEHNKVGKRMITGVFSHWDCFDPQANPGGIWLPVELHRSGPVRLHHARLRTEHCDAHLAQLRFALDLDATQATPIQIEISFPPLTFHGETQIFTCNADYVAARRRWPVC